MRGAPLRTLPASSCTWMSPDASEVRVLSRIKVACGSAKKMTIPTTAAIGTIKIETNRNLAEPITKANMTQASTAISAPLDPKARTR